MLKYLLITKKNHLNFLICLSFLITGCVPTLPIVKDDPLLELPGGYPFIAPIPQPTPELSSSPTPSPELSPNPYPSVSPSPELSPVIEVSPTPSPQPSSIAVQRWKDFFTDSSLNLMIDKSLKANQELRIIEQEIHIAHNRYYARQGKYLPNLGVQAGYDLSKQGQYTSQGVSDSSNHVPNNLQTGSLSLTSSWEIDLWGKLRNSAKSAYLSYLSSIEGKKFVVTQLVSEVANSYYELMALDNQLEIVNSYVKVLQEIKLMVELQREAARATSLGVKRFEAEVYKNKAHQYSLQQKIILTQNKLNALIGQYPQDLKRDAKNFLEISFPKMETGIPSHLLENRPDIKAASYDLEAAKLNVSSARARFFPSLTIEAGVGFESFNAAHFFNIPGSFYNLAGNLTAPLLNRQAIKASYFSANNKQIQTVYKYEQTLINAYAEVANQLNAIRNYSEMYELKSKQVAALKDSVEISYMLFQAARIDYIDALFTQRDTLDAQLDLIEVKRKQLSAYINLYKSLGGGWKEDLISENNHQSTSMLQ